MNSLLSKNAIILQLEKDSDEKDEKKDSNRQKSPEVLDTNFDCMDCFSELKAPEIINNRIYNEALLKKIEEAINEGTFERCTKKEKIDSLLRAFRNIYPSLPESLQNILTGENVDADFERNCDKKPDWLDLAKLRRGQEFARNNITGVSFAELLSLFALFSFQHGLKPMIVTGKSSTPYTAFKRSLNFHLKLRNSFYKVHCQFSRRDMAYDATI